MSERMNSNGNHNITCCVRLARNIYIKNGTQTITAQPKKKQKANTMKAAKYIDNLH